MSDTQKHTKPNVPNLRFPGFEGEWKEYKNERLFSISKEKNKSREYHTVLSASQTEGMVERDSLGIDIKYEAESVSGYKIVRPGEYVIHLRSFQGGFAFSDTTGICSPAYTILHPAEVLSYGFLREYFMSQKFIDSLRLVTYGIRDGKSISVEEWMKLKTYIPKSFKEQERIKKFLDLIDKRITIQNKIIERYQSLIRAITKALVITDGKSVKLGDIAEIYQPRTISVLQMTSKDKYPVYGANGIIGHYSDYNHATEQICIACRGNTCGVVNYSKPFSWITGNSMVINVDQSAKAKLINKRYLFHLLSTVDYTPLISGSGQPQIVRGPLRNMHVVLPCIEKQNLVAQLLDAMVERHEVEKEIMSRLATQKQTLLNQLFI